MVIKEGVTLQALINLRGKIGELRSLSQDMIGDSNFEDDLDAQIAKLNIAIANHTVTPLELRKRALELDLEKGYDSEALNYSMMSLILETLHSLPQYRAAAKEIGRIVDLSFAGADLEQSPSEDQGEEASDNADMGRSKEPAPHRSRIRRG